MTANAPRLVVVDSVVVDVVMEVDSLPERGSDTFVHSSSTYAGGAFNVLAAAARLGMPSLYAGAHGTGPFATVAWEQLHREGIEIALAANRALDSGFVVTLVDADAERTFLTSSGAEAGLTIEQLRRVELRDDDLIYFSGYALLHESNAVALLDLVRRLPVTASLFFDPGPLVADIAESLLSPIFERADWFSCNAREATVLSRVDGARGAATALNERLARGGVVVRTGVDGCVVATAEGSDVVEGFNVTAIDSNGAGDCHVGAFAVFMSEGEGCVEAARLANAAAALSVTRRGPANGPTRHELEEFLRGHSVGRGDLD